MGTKKILLGKHHKPKVSPNLRDTQQMQTYGGRQHGASSRQILCVVLAPWLWIASIPFMKAASHDMPMRSIKALRGDYFITLYKGDDIAAAWGG